MESKSLPLFQQTTLPNTVEECHILIRELFALQREFFKRVEKLEIENNALKERLNVNSSNSSLPPSRDHKRKKKARSSSTRPSGGQPGHPGHFRKMLDSSEVDSIIKCSLPERCVCGGFFALKEGYQRHQVYELPEIKLHVTEYQLAKGCCIRCHQSQVATLPADVNWGMTGHRLTSFLSHLVSSYHLSRRTLQGFLKEQYGFDISLGTVFNKQRLINTVLAEPIAELRTNMLETSPWLNVDETGHKRDGKKQWLWGAMSSTAAYFSVEPSRGKKVLKTLLGDFKQIVISDRYAAYNLFDSSQRQICWAHLKRDFTRLAEKKEPVIRRLGKALLDQETKLFSVWHAFKRGAMTREILIWQVAPIRRQVGDYLEQGSYTDPQLRAARFCKNLLKNFDALWTFTMAEGVEPTNNHGERCLRPNVLWRKNYFGTRSDYGSEFVARTASLTMTCRLQSKNAFEYLCQATQHYFMKTAAPPLT